MKLLAFIVLTLCASIDGIKSNSKIINGELARETQFPHFVQLSIRTSENPQYCGGSLLNDRWVLTAAHCFKKMISVKAYLGSVFWRKMPVKMAVKEVIIHPLYINVNAHDIALVKLERSVNFTENIQPISLPDGKSTNHSKGFLYVPGFGETKNSSQSMLYMRFVRMKEITNDECSESWGWNIHESQLCAVGQEQQQSTCRGDSGSGIIQKTEKKNVVLGIVSYGAPGCLGKPKVFTRVSSYLDFIHAVMENE